MNKKKTFILLFLATIFSMVSDKICVLEGSQAYQLIEKIELSNYPRGICYDSVYNKIYVACWKDGTEYIYVINGNTYAIETTITTQLDNHGAVVVSPDGRYIYATNYYGGSVTRFDTTNNYSKTTLSLGSWANEMRISADGSNLYVVLGADGRVWIDDTGSKIAIVNTSNFTSGGVEYINLPEATYGETHELVLSPDNTKLYITALKSNGSVWYQRWVHTISLTSKSVTKSVEGYGGIGIGRIIDVTSDGQLLYISNDTGNKIDVLGSSELTFQYSISVDSRPAVIEISPDDKYALVFTSPSVVSIIDINTKSIIQTIPGFAGDFSDGDIVFNPTGDFVYGVNAADPGNLFILKKIGASSVGSISGKMTKSDGTTAISGVLVEALQSGVVKSSATTNSSGNYSITLSTGTYDVRASATGYETVTQTNKVVSAGQTTTVNISLTAISTIMTISGKVTKMDGTTPITGVTVELLQGTNVTDNTTTDIGGNYEFIGVATGTYTVRASWQVNGVEASVYEQTKSTAPLNFTLSLTLQLAEVSGQVSGIISRNNTAYSKWLSASPSNKRKILSTEKNVTFVELMQKGKTVVKVPVDERGNYSIPNLLPGEYYIRAYNGYLYSETKRVRVTEGQALSISFAFPLLEKDKVYAYPNPTKKGEITIHLVTSAINNEVKVSVYNVAGELVREIKDEEMNKTKFPVLEYLWNCRNDKGSKVASGVYIYIIKLEDRDTGREEKVTKKLAVVR